ncbi:type VII secretion protein EssB [Bacillus sp. CGMCC 1.16541]|uniref:type VII secretion protein EssB n=1 Tax=Bacillus sp. CGMCC 1.16541 TaxID=2185143 RepID=UPI000D72C3DC|nr:type VII secretion protein EssB [Bacillus sp. CGMCC 1.16541]
MSEKKVTYLEQRTEAVMTKEKEMYTFTFQKEKIRLGHVLEVEMLKDVHPFFICDILMNENELKIQLQTPRTFKSFSQLKAKQELQKWLFSYQLVKKVEQHHHSRLHLLVCPENIVFDQGGMPHFLHYGVKESIPPYEKEEGRLFDELKATIAAAVDRTHSFYEYLTQYQTLQLSENAQRVMASKNIDELEAVIERKIDELEKKERLFVKLPEKQWKWLRYTTVGVGVLLVPALGYMAYNLFFQQPKQEAFMGANEAFIQQKYSGVADELENYQVDEMPPVVQYELAYSYVMNKNLPDTATDNILNALTLQSDPSYFAYWIHIGRGEGEAALEIARALDERDLIITALNTYVNELKSNQKLSSADRQKKLDEARRELDEFKEEIKREQEEAEKEEQSTSATPSEPAKPVNQPIEQPAIDQSTKQPAAEQPVQQPEPKEPAVEKNPS